MRPILGSDDVGLPWFDQRGIGFRGPRRTGDNPLLDGLEFGW